MNPKEKAQEIYSKMDWFTHGYVGSSMLSNTEFYDVKIKNTKAAAQIVVDEAKSVADASSETENAFWQSVTDELKNL
jgi:hypothetical protein